MRALAALGPLPFSALLVGDGPERPEVEAEIRALEIGDAVELAGSRADVPDLLVDMGGGASNERVAFLEAVRQAELDERDEPFLERMRSTTVRSPSGRRRLQSPAVLAPVTVAGGPHRGTVDVPRAADGTIRPHLEVDQPGPLDADAVRDGLSVVASKSLVEIVGATPLDVWPEHLGLREPKDVVRLGADHADLLQGWTMATLAQGDSRWALALLPFPGSGPELLSVVPPSVAQAVLTDLIRGRSEIAPTAYVTSFGRARRRGMRP